MTKLDEHKPPPKVLMDLFEEIVAENPRASREELFRKYEAAVKADHQLREAVIEYAFDTEDKRSFN